MVVLDIAAMVDKLKLPERSHPHGTAHAILCQARAVSSCTNTLKGKDDIKGAAELRAVLLVLAAYTVALLEHLEEQHRPNRWRTGEGWPC